MNRAPTMTTAMARTLERLPEEKRRDVLERAALIYDGCPGITWQEADERALEAEGLKQRTLPGVDDGR